MAVPTSARMTIAAWVVTKLNAINGGTNYNHTVSGCSRAMKVIDQITPDQCPWVGVFATESVGRMAPGGWYESDVTISVFLLMKPSTGRFGSDSADVLAEELLADALKAILAAAKEPTTSAYIERFMVTPDVDEENGRWSLKRLDLFWKLPQATRGA